MAKDLWKVSDSLPCTYHVLVTWFTLSRRGLLAPWHSSTVVASTTTVTRSLPTRTTEPNRHTQRSQHSFYSYSKAIPVPSQSPLSQPQPMV